MTKLKNVRHEKFSQDYSTNKDGKASYIQAGYKARGNSAEVLASNLLRNVKVVDRIDEIREKNQALLGIEKKEILNKLKDMLSANLVEMTDAELQKLPKEIQLCINKIETTTSWVDKVLYKTHKIWILDKLKAVEIINKMCGWNEPEKVDIMGKSIEKIGEAIQRIAKSK